MALAWNEIGEQDAWTLEADEFKLLPGMTDKGRLGFAIQLKFRQIRDRYPEHLDEINPTVVRWVADLWDAYPGLYRFAKLLELIAAGIQSGDIKVPQ